MLLLWDACSREFTFFFLQPAGEQPIIILRREQIQENYQSRAKHTQKHTQPKERSIKEKEKKYSQENVVKGWKPYSVATNKTGNKINSSSKNKNTTSTEDVDSCNIVQMSTLRGKQKPVWNSQMLNSMALLNVLYWMFSQRACTLIML